MSPLRSLLALAALWIASGCELHRVLTIKPDGSGQIAEHYLAPSDIFKQQPKAGDTGGQLSIIPPSATSVEKDAKNYGEGVTLVSYKVIQAGEMQGYDAVYEFADVNKIKVGAFMSDGTSNPGDEEPAPDTGPRTFQFTKGAVNELTIPIKVNKGKKEDASQGIPEAKQDPEQRKALVEALKHIEFRIAIRVAGKIEETNAHFRKDNEVILREMNFKGMAADPKYADAFKDAAAGKTSPEERPDDERYFKDETAEAVKIGFK